MYSSRKKEEKKKENLDNKKIAEFDGVHHRRYPT